MTPPNVLVCPRCSAAAAGNYCANCGAPLAGATCPSCDAPLTPGANFCHRCGTATTRNAPGAGGEARGFSAGLPWGVAVVAFVALVALVIGQRFGARAQSGGAAAGDAGAAVPQAPIPSLGARAPDISAMTPEEQAARLHDRIMALAERGQTDSVQFFAPMAIAAFQRLESLNADQRYDLGSIAQVAGEPEIARAQADTILAFNANHLLGLMLAIRAARAAGDTPRAQALERRFAAIGPAERRRQLPEYALHEREIEAALAAIRGPRS
jgi:Double zinc ribbon